MTSCHRFFRLVQICPVLLVALAISLLLARSSSAQAGTGAVTGTVTDPQGNVLQGAKVRLTPGTATAITNAQGIYSVLGLPAGGYTVTVAYVGFKDATAAAQVSPGQTVRLDEQLAVSSGKQTVQVYSGRVGGELEAINRTFNAPNIINVLPADVIVSLPNANVADAIGRLPDVTLERDEGEGKYVQVRGTEPRLTHTTLDGVTIASPETVRQIKLDIIPARLVESVQINKTLQANMEGAGIGGSVDLRTKSAEDRPTLDLEALGGYNPIIGGRPNYQFDGALGRRFLAGKKLGALFAGSYDWNGRGINDVEPGPALSGTYDLRDYQYYRGRWGIGGTLDYRLSDTSNLFLKGLYSHFDNFGSDWIYSPAINSFADDTTLTQGAGDGTIGFEVLNRRPVQDLGGLQIGGHHVLRQALFNWDLNASVARTRDQGYATAHFDPFSDTNPLNNIQYQLNLAHPLEPKLVVQNGVNIFDPTHLFYSYQQIQYFYNPEVDLGFGASLSLPYTFAGHSNTFEFGGRFRNEHKFVNQDTRYSAPLAAALNSEDPSIAMSNFLGSFRDPGYYGGDYAFGPTADYNRVNAFQAVGPDPNHSNLLGNQFNQIEKVSAGYLMNTTELGRFRLYLGLRFEATSENTLGYVSTARTPTAGNSNAPPTRVNTSYLNPLPSASVRYAITPDSALRLVYGRGLSRPNFGDLVPFATVTSASAARPTVSRGNPALKTEYADDIDLLYENNLRSSGLLQAGFFYKFLHDPLIATQTRLPATDPNYPNYLQNQTINAGSAYVYGLEISFQQHFTYLPGLLNGFGVSANYGYTGSQATLPPYLANPQPGQISGPNRGPGNQKPALLRQSPNTFNLSPTYDKRNLSVRLGVTYNQANIDYYNYNNGDAGPITQGGGGGGLHGPNGDNYFYSHLQIDLQGTYRLPRGFTAVAYGLNLNNEVFGFYQGSPIYPVQREFYRQTFGGGLRWSPHRER